MTNPRPNALRPWVIVAIALPLALAVAWGSGLFDAPPAPPIADRELRELEHMPKAPPRDRHPERPPLVLFLGDSRYLKATRGSNAGVWAQRPHKLTIDGSAYEVMTLFTRAGATVADLDKYVDDILRWQPDLLVLQPELLVEETSFRGLAPAAMQTEARLENWRLRLSLWADKVELPKAGRALPAARRLIERARGEGIRIAVAQIPPSAAIAGAVPSGYYETMRALVCTLLERCERDFLTFAASYPDKYFRDPLHLNAAGRDVFFPALMRAVGGLLRE